MDDERRFWTFASGILGGLAILKGLHHPNAWTATQVQVDYSFGFVKRGFIGEALRLSGFQIQHYNTHIVVSAIFLIMMIVMLAALTYRSHAMRIADGAPCAVFFGSFALTYLVYVIGYFDIPLVALTALAILPRRFELRLVAVLVTGAIGILIHEAYLITLLPVALLSLILTEAK